MKYKTIKDVHVLRRTPMSWTWTCLNCDLEKEGYPDVYENFEPKLTRHSVVFSAYCKACRDKFDNFVTDKNNMSQDTPDDLMVHRCHGCGELSVGYKSIKELVYPVTRYERTFQGRCKACDKERRDDYNFKNQ